MLNKKELNPNIHLSEGNIKSKNTEDVVFLTWSLRSRIHCPYATAECKKRCFARKNETFTGVRASRDRNFEESQKETFVQDMINILEYQLSRKKMNNKRVFIRIHTSGDFYSLDYLIKWTNIAEYFKDNKQILFQAYTKSMPIIKKYIGDYKTTYGNDLTDKEILEDMNIHFVWSVWHDTPNEYTNLAKELEMQVFTALPKDKIKEAVTSGSFLCNGDCGNCRQCYTGRVKSIVIPYH